ncbi:MAG TPA: bifunctional DNA-binding transcriptional regulator/O6-methylguanine-DNA methyltransferase Ada [Pirellulales bacterium]|nr:bifunctional DNA-binding transcriptional regulator/O6-methylguanine-DNA methyltransferase Ada [Pirellulales bacterium]
MTASTMTASIYTEPAIVSRRKRSFSTADVRWQAVERRDPAADGVFYCAVRTTGIYCRPSCASRRPRRANVVFFATWAEAERAGFRACRRCHPKRPAGADPHAPLVARACRQIEQAEKTPSLGELAAAAGLSPWHFQRVFKRVTGISPKAYAAQWQAERVRAQLAPARSATRAILAAGFGSTGSFYQKSRQLLGMSPQAFRQGGAGTEIHFAIGKSSLGSVLVAATDRGVCAVQLGDDRAALVRALRARFPRADVRPADAAFQKTLSTVIRLVETPGQVVELPLDVRGTAFQRRVWQALCRIPVGKTMTYAELAAALGQPTAQRAVAQACGANPVAVVIPCHRVVRSDGGLGGYRWGVERKDELLRREQAPQRRRPTNK